MSRDEFRFQLPDGIDQLDQAFWRVPSGIGKLRTEVLFEHGALTDHRLDGSDRNHGPRLTRSSRKNEPEHAHLPRLVIKPIRDNKF
jgi:hypothetical protein